MIDFFCKFFYLFFYTIIGDNMKKLDFLDRYLLDSKYKITVYDKMINIINYVSIEDFSSTKIVVRFDGGVTTIIGNNLVISKMQDDELIILGNFISIQV